MKRVVVGLAVVLGLVGTSLYAVPPGTDDEIRTRLEPFGNSCRVGEDCGVAAAVADTGPLSGEQVYNQFCFACHATGVSDAPILGDAASWGPRLDKSMDELMQTTLNGINAMPPKGTCMNCSDDELAGAVTYMLEQAQ